MRKRNYSIILIGIFLLILIQCGRGPEKASAGESKITIGMVADEWLFSLEKAGTWAAQQMFLPLVYKDSRGEWEPALAERWEHSDDYKEWIFFLRKDVKWHDGKPTTAHDVKFTFDLLKSPDVGDWRHPISSVEVIDDYSLIIRYKQPKEYGWFQVFYPKHILAELDPKEFWEWNFWKLGISLDRGREVIEPYI